MSKSPQGLYGLISTPISTPPALAPTPTPTSTPIPTTTTATPSSSNSDMITSATLQFSNGTTDYGTVASNGLAYDTVYSAFNLMDIFILTVPAMQLKVAENINRFSLTRVEL